MRDRETKTWRKRKRSSIWWFTPHWFTWLDLNQSKPRGFIQVSILGAWNQGLEPSSDPSVINAQGAGLEVDQPGIEPAHI